MELRNFFHFFNIQLHDCEMGAFTSTDADQDLRGFKAFVVKFMLEMSKVVFPLSVNHFCSIS